MLALFLVAALTCYCASATRSAQSIEQRLNKLMGTCTCNDMRSTRRRLTIGKKRVARKTTGSIQWEKPETDETHDRRQTTPARAARPSTSVRTPSQSLVSNSETRETDSSVSATEKGSEEVREIPRMTTYWDPIADKERPAIIVQDGEEVEGKAATMTGFPLLEGQEFAGEQEFALLEASASDDQDIPLLEETGEQINKRAKVARAVGGTMMVLGGLAGTTLGVWAGVDPSIVANADSTGLSTGGIIGIVAASAVFVIGLITCIVSKQKCCTGL